MSQEKIAIPDDLLQLSQRLQEWRSSHPPRSRLPEPMWVAAVEMAQREGLHRTAKALRLDYTRLKERLPATAPAFLELLTAPTAGSAECVVELESARGRMRVAMKGVALDWASLQHAWREADR
jgi:hypothetical protein